jgi:elongation factor P
MATKASDLKPGNALSLDGQIFLIVDTDHVKPGKGPAYTQTKLRNVKTGANVEKRFGSDDEVERVNVDRRKMEYLYDDHTGAMFMDQETFEQVPVPYAVLGEKAKYIKANTEVTGLFYEGNVLNVELPPSVELQITETPPGVKNATAANQLKEAHTETGLTVKVPPFLENGDVVRVSTDNGQYLARAERAKG